MTLSDIFGDWSSIKPILIEQGYSQNYIELAEKRLSTSTKTYDKYVRAKKATQQIGQTYFLTNLADRDEIAYNLLSCGSRIVVARNKETGVLEVAAGYFCQKRLCALCAFRRSVKKFMNTAEIIAQDEYSNMQWVFITLTIKNCTGEDLKKTIERILSAFSKMTDNKNSLFRKSFKGWFRSLEVTYNDETNEYHPHLHILACVDNDYFHSKKYFSKDRLIKHWKKYLNKAEYKEPGKKLIHGGHRNQHVGVVDVSEKKTFAPIEYNPSVKINKVRGRREKQIAEVAKYTVKPMDYSGKPEVLATFTTALDRVRCTAYGGMMRETFQRLRLEDTEDGIDVKKMENRLEKFLSDPNYTLYMLNWNGGAKMYEMALYEKDTGSVFTVADEAVE